MGLLKIQYDAKYQKIEGGPFGDIKKFSKKRKKNLRRGDPLGFLKLQFAAKYREPFGDKKNFQKKLPSAEKKLKRRHFSLVPFCM